MKLLENDDAESYFVEFTLSDLTLAPTRKDAVVEIDGTLYWYPPDDPDRGWPDTDTDDLDREMTRERVGMLRALRLDWDSGNALYEADTRDSDAEGVAGYVRSDEFMEWAALEGVSDTDVLYVASVILAPAHRKKGLGLAFVRKFLRSFGHPGRVVLLKPFPAGEWGADGPEERTSAQTQEGEDKLRAHWAQLGFQSLPGEYMALNCDWRTPDLWKQEPRTHYDKPEDILDEPQPDCDDCASKACTDCSVWETED